MPLVLAAVAAGGLLLSGLGFLSGFLSGRGGTSSTGGAMTQCGWGSEREPTCWIEGPWDGERVGDFVEVRVGFRAREGILGRPVGRVNTVVVWGYSEEEGWERLGWEHLVPGEQEGEVEFEVDLSERTEESSVELVARVWQGMQTGVSEPVHVTVDRTAPETPMLHLLYGCKDALTVSWVTPGDPVSGDVFPVANEELRFSDQPFLWEEGEVAKAGEPLAPGEMAHATVSSRLPETVTYFQLRVYDQAGNWVESEEVGFMTEGNVSHLTGQVTEDSFLAEGTYYVTESLTVVPGKTLEVEAGVVLKLGPDAWIGVEDETGSLWLEGQPQAPVVVTSAGDDSVGEILPGTRDLPGVGAHQGLFLNSLCQVNEARVSFAETGLQVLGSCPVKNSVFFDCVQGIRFLPSATGASATGHCVHNCLLWVANGEDPLTEPLTAIEIAHEGTEEIRFVTIVGYDVGVKVTSGEAEIRESLIAECKVGIEIATGTKVFGDDNRTWFNQVNEQGEGSVEAGENWTDLEETPFWGEAQGEPFPSIPSESERYFLLNGVDAEPVNQGTLNSDEAATELSIDLSHRTAIGWEEGTRGRWMDANGSDIGWHDDMTKEINYLRLTGYIEKDLRIQSGWTVCFDEGFLGILEATVVIEPGVVVKGKFAQPQEVETLLLKTASVDPEERETSRRFPWNVSELTEEEMAFLPGLRVWGEEESLVKTVSMSLEATTPEETTEEEALQNTGRLIACGSPMSRIVWTHWVDADHGMVLDGAPSETPPLENAGEEWGGPWVGIGLTEGASPLTRIEYCDFYYAALAIHVLEEMEQGVRNCRFFDCGVGVAEWAGNEVRNCLFSFPSLMDTPEEEPYEGTRCVWALGSASWKKSRVLNCTMDRGETGVSVGPFLGVWEGIRAEVEDCLFTRLTSGIEGYTPELYEDIHDNLFYSVEEMIKGVPTSLDESNVWVTSEEEPFDETWLSEGRGIEEAWHLDQTTEAVDFDQEKNALMEGLAGMTTALDGRLDQGALDAGFHYPRMWETTAWPVGFRGWAIEEGIELAWDWAGGEPYPEFTIEYSTVSYGYTDEVLSDFVPGDTGVYLGNVLSGCTYYFTIVVAEDALAQTEVSIPQTSLPTPTPTSTPLTTATTTPIPTPISTPTSAPPTTPTPSYACPEIRITSGKGNHSNINWSNDGRYLYYLRRLNDKDCIYRCQVEANAEEEPLVEMLRDCFWPVLSPSYEKMAFCHEDDQGFLQIWQCDLLNGLSTSQSTFSSRNKYFPEWRPSTLELVCYASHEGISQLVKVIGQIETDILEEEDAGFVVPTYSPSGQWIAFDYFGGSLSSGLYRQLSKTDSEGLLGIIPLETIQPGWTLSAWPRWSPDGSRLCFAREDITGRLQIYTTSSEEEDLRMVTIEDADHYNPQWTPDQQWLVYTREDATGHRQVWKVPVEGGTELQLTETSTDHWGTRVSPDGQWIAFVRLDQTGNEQVYMVQSDRCLSPAPSLTPTSTHTPTFTCTPTSTCTPAPTPTATPSPEYEIVSWGDDDYGQVTDTPLGADYVAIAAGAYHSLALRTDGSIVGWGDNGVGQANSPDGTNYVAITAGAYHSLAVKSDHSIVGWGWDDYNQVSGIPTGTGFIAISAGDFHSLTLKTNGSIVSWGLDIEGLVADTPIGTSFVQIAAGGYHSLALRNDGTIVGWGYDGNGQASPPTGGDYVAIAAGLVHSLALRNDGTLTAWGSNEYGQTSPPDGSDYVAITAGAHHSLALRSDGTVIAWGDDTYGQKSVPESSRCVAIAAGSYHCVALRLSQTPVETPTPTPTNWTPTPTPTNWTPTPTPTNWTPTPTDTATATLTGTNTPIPTETPIPLPTCCYDQDRENPFDFLWGEDVESEWVKTDEYRYYSSWEPHKLKWKSNYGVPVGTELSLKAFPWWAEPGLYPASDFGISLNGPEGPYTFFQEYDWPLVVALNSNEMEIWIKDFPIPDDIYTGRGTLIVKPDISQSDLPPGISSSDVGISQQTEFILFDLDADSMNRGDVIEPPPFYISYLNGGYVDGIEDNEGSPETPGCFVPCTTSDTDEDGIPDYADGYDILGTSSSLDDSNAEKLFTPVWLWISHSLFDHDGYLCQETGKMVVFEYPASDPSAVDPQSFDINDEWDENSGAIRIWTKPSDQPRDPRPYAEGGDYIAPNQPIYLNPSRFEWYFDISSFHEADIIFLYVEAVRPSVDFADIRVAVRGADLAHADYGDAVRFTATGPLELFRDQKCTRVLDDWPKIDAQHPRSPKYIFGQQDKIYARLSAPAGLGDDYLRVNVMSESSDPTRIQLGLSETENGYVNILDPLGLGEITQYGDESGDINYIQSDDEEVLTFDLCINGYQTGCSEDVLVDRGEYLMICGSDWALSSSIVPYATQNLETADDRIQSMYQWYRNGYLKGYTYWPWDATAENQKYEERKDTALTEGKVGGKTCSDVIFYSGHGDLGEVNVVKEGSDPSVFPGVCWKPTNPYVERAWSQDVEFPVFDACQILGKDRVLSPDEYIHRWTFDAPIHAVLATCDIVRFEALDDDLPVFVEQLNNEVNVVDAWKNGCLLGFMKTPYGILVRPDNRYDYLVSPSSSDKCLTRDILPTGQPEPYYYYWYPDKQKIVNLTEASGSPDSKRDLENRSRLFKALKFSGTRPLPPYSPPSGEYLIPEMTKRARGNFDVIHGDASRLLCLNRRRSSCLETEHARQGEVGADDANTLLRANGVDVPDSYHLRNRAKKMAKLFSPTTEEEWCEGEVFYFNRRINGMCILNDIATVVISNDEVELIDLDRQEVHETKGYEVKGLDVVDIEGVDAHKITAELVYVARDASLVPLWSVAYEEKVYLFDARTGEFYVW